MKRLTIPDEKTEGGWKRAVIDPGEVKKYAMTLYWMMKKYEDTGLTPDEINALRERDTAKAPEKLSRYWLKCPSCGLHIGRMEDNFCPECGQRLKRED